MVSKVFLFGKYKWLYCSDVRLKDEVYSGWVENGAWHMIYDTKTGLLEAYQSTREKRLDWKPVTSVIVNLDWMCYPRGIDNNDVINDAEKRYKAGEEANYSLEPIKKTKTDIYGDEVPF